MTLANTSIQRLAAAKNMMSEGLSLEYCAGMFSLPVDELDAYIQAGLFVESSTDIPEINTPLFEDVTDKTFEEIQARVHANSEPDWSKHSFHKTVRDCPYPTKGHLSTGGVQGHSAGDIFPYTVVLVGDAVDHDYHLIGGGLNIGDCKWGHYNAAHNYATQLLNPLLME